jgi:energy-coupling factor transporter ATP-binding protein EcfA2
MQVNKTKSVGVTKPTHVQRIEVDSLFGYLNYTIPRRGSRSVDFSHLMMLYGDNGCGKTTILTLLFSLLTPQDRQGHKTFVARTPFKRFAVYFDDGTNLSAEKTGELIGDYSVSINFPDRDQAKFNLKAGAESKVRNDEQLNGLLAELVRLSIAMYFLPDDRRVRSSLGIRIRSTLGREDTLELDDNLLFLENLRRQEFLSHSRSSQDDRESHHLDLAPVIASINTWFREHAFEGSNVGEESATSIYLQVIAQIASLAGASDLSAKKDGSNLGTRLAALATEVSAFSPFGLIQPFPADKFIATVESANPQARGTIETVLKPYLDGLTARLKALTVVRDLLANYVETINSFLTDKSMEFTLQSGVVIKGYGGNPLDPNVLSSGEKQLVLLLSNTILARDATSIFIIDEPELSLNVKWQRRLVDALLKCARGSNIQYLLASHSIELITQHMDHAVQLIPTDRPTQ